MPYGIASECSAADARHFVPLDAALRSRGIKVHYTTWMRLVRRKGLPAKKFGGRYYVNLDDLDRWIAEQSVAAVTAPPVPAAPRAMQPAAAEVVLKSRRTRHSRRHGGLCQ